MSLNIYAWPYSRVLLVGSMALLLWMVIQHSLPKKLLVPFNFIASIAALGIIYRYCIYGRVSSGTSVFHLIEVYGNEIWREILFNAVLYLPLGITVSTLLGWWTVLLGAGLSLSVELWQYYAMTGTAQGTDLLANIIGCALGCLPTFIYSFRCKR